VAVARLDIEYDGSGFAGWARQPRQRTVQGELERALGIVLREPVTLTVGGRTDRGVHAWGQVASYDGPTPPPGVDALRSLNALVADDVAVLGWREVHGGFDARRDACSRTYCYRVLHRREPSAFLRGRALWWPRPLDREVLTTCAAALAGTHDFTAFTPTESDHVRFERNVVGARWEVRGDVLEFWIEADSFMRHMNRALVGTMLEVAAGRRTLGSFRALLDGRPRADAGETAPAHGLYLASVRYDG
jgi:tRNA pseudouridine38-40 synthase